MHRSVRFAALVPTFALTACGALFNGGPANVTFNSNPAGAQVLVDGNAMGVTPTTLQLDKGKDHTITFRKAGFADTNYQLSNRVSVKYVVLDVLGGFIPIIVDAATGSWYVLTTDAVNVQMAPQQALMSGQLTPEQLGAVRLGARVSDFVDTARIVRAVTADAQ